MADQENSSRAQQAVCYAVYSWMFKDDAPIETIEGAFAEMVAIGDEVQGIQRASWGRNRAGSANGYTHTMIVVADDQAAVDEYNLRTSKHPMSGLVHSSEKQGVGVSYALPA
ncbi:hypothetical protein JOF29_002501 [Kribbella aluminosa]|uniref:Stress-response A/B barrel domain-containing protein n=1 Tax=Kribbella aluminosa TaxID=416017 RepID=A0ABS4UII6_9ACTN|nr:Dabb family protein [Kribbella aluminosa]MBP2351418.1 hypothetical protein [Kribbella aluminosa]